MAHPLTELAKIYTHPTGETHKIIAHTGKSGLSPVNIPPSILPSLSESQRRYILELRHYQRFRCSGFSAQQLVDIEAFAPAHISQTVNGGQDIETALENLQVIPIHPLFSNRKWKNFRFKHIGNIPLGNGRPGYFEPNNPLVWKVLEPCLRLASGFMSNTYALTWWDALLNGDYSCVEEGIPDKWRGCQILKFRPTRGTRSTEEQVQGQLHDIARRITYTIVSGRTDQYSGLPLWGESPFNYGLCSQDAAGNIHISLALEILEPLMRDDISLTIAEIRLDCFRVAVTLMHEIAHAVWYSIRDRHVPAGNKVRLEPYLDGQPMSELGFSMEEIIFGGSTASITDFYIPRRIGRGVPCATILCETSFSKRHWDTSAKDHPLLHPLPPDWNYQDTFPIPVGYFEDLFRPEFWDYVRQFGLRATRMGPKTIGIRIQRLQDQTVKTSWSPNVDIIPDSDISLNNLMTREQEMAVRLENLRRARARRILNNIRNEEDMTIRADLDPGDAMEVDDPEGVSEVTDPNNYLTQGKNFLSSSEILTESGHYRLPSCPRYEEIRSYILANRGQGRLCLDTMNFNMPAYTMFQYINQLGGLTITHQEWIAFLENCDDRGECFTYSEEGCGVVNWEETAPPSPDAAPSMPAPDTEVWFRELCLGNPWFYAAFADMDFWFLLRTLKQLDPREGGWLNARVLRDLINWHDAQGDLWRWGPNGIIRKRTDTWPLYESADDSSSSSNAANS